MAMVQWPRRPEKKRIWRPGQHAGAVMAELERQGNEGKGDVDWARLPEASVRSGAIDLYHKEVQERSVEGTNDNVISKEKWGRGKSCVPVWLSRWFPDMLSLSRDMWLLNSSLSAGQKRQKTRLQFRPESHDILSPPHLVYCNSLWCCSPHMLKARSSVSLHFIWQSRSQDPRVTCISE